MQKLVPVRSATGEQKTKLQKGAAQLPSTISSKEEAIRPSDVKASASGSNGADGNATRQKGQPKRDEPTLADKEVVPLLCSEVLKLMVNVRQNNAILYDTYRVKSDSSIAEDLILMGVEYNRRTRGQKGHTWGSPWWHLWQCIVDWTEKRLGESTTEMETEELTVLKTAFEEYKTRHAMPKCYADEVKQVKVWESENSHMLMISVTGVAKDFWDRIVMKIAGEVIQKTESPMAPPSHNERRLRKFVQRKK
eukprot:TRINITY_DN65554_c0_g1_i1.p2 TRINITY_DN65554_c0_g1~~TRINITY_DN65554_c0_g1_i1.p2  ORF type:complete len:250 (-),score=51.14 TRINITY_DN65554_c0_g1_i1:553-1302(-)